MGKAVPAIPEHRARGHALWAPGGAPVGVAFVGRTSTSTMQDPVASLLRQYRLSGGRLPEGFYISRCYWDIESGGIDLDARSQTDLWRKFADAGIPRDGGIAELRADVAAGSQPFSAVICEDINRIGRDMLSSLRLEKELGAAGVLIFATSEPIDMQAPQASTKLVRMTKMAESEYFKLNLKTNMWEGLTQYAIGGHNTGPAPYGYAEERTTHPNPLKAAMGASRARLAPHPEQAIWVTRMFEWRAWEKLSVAGIARRLTDLGAPPPGQGRAWSTGTVYGILKNPKYTGRIVLGRTTNTGPTRRRGEKKIISLPREYWTWSAPENAHEALTDLETWEKAQTVGRERGNSMDPGTRHLGRSSGRLYPYRSKIHCNQCHRRMHGAQSTTRRPGQMLTYYVCPTQMHKPQDKAAWPDHVRASIREDALTAKLSEFLDDYALGYDRAARLAQLIPASQAQQDDLDHARTQTLSRKLAQAEAALNGIAAELGQLAGKTDKVSQAIRDRLTAQFSQRDDEKTAIEAELAAIEQAAPLPDSDLTLIDELPYAPGLLACAPDDLRERLAAAFGMQAVYRQDTRQATIVLTITDTTPGIIDAILADPRVDHDTDNPTTSNDTSADVTQSPIATKTDEGSPIAVGRGRWSGTSGGEKRYWGPRRDGELVPSVVDMHPSPVFPACRDGDPCPDVALAARRLIRTFGQGEGAVHAVAGLDLELAAGSFTAVIGPSGSGKSTLLHLLAGLDQPTGGSVRLGRTELNTLDEDALTALRRDQMGFVLQDFSLLPALTVAENIDLPFSLGLDRGRRDARWRDHLIGALGLGGLLDRRPGQLSGGQQQRVAVVRALAHRPAVVFADEPTGNLDLATGRRLLSLLRGLAAEQRVTVVMVTHDVAAAALADRVIVLSDGTVARDIAIAGTTSAEGLAAIVVAAGGDR